MTLIMLHFKHELCFFFRIATREEISANAEEFEERKAELLAKMQKVRLWLIVLYVCLPALHCFILFTLCYKNNM